MQSELDAQAGPIWNQLSPLLDEAMLRLGQADRDALVLRYFEGRSLNEVGSALGASEDAAKKRVNRALEKLRNFFAKRGVHSTTSAIAETISANSVLIAPATLAKTATAVALAKGVTASVSTLTLIKGALKIMAWTKAKTAVVVGVGILFAAGTTTITVKQISHHREESVWNHISAVDPRQLDAAPATVSIRPTKFVPPASGWVTSSSKLLGLDQPLAALLAMAYNASEYRVLPLIPLPKGNYDFIVSVPDPQRRTAQEKIRQSFGVVARRETRETDVLLLTRNQRYAPGLKSSSAKDCSFGLNRGNLHCVGGSFADLASFLERYLGTPVVDQTKVGGRFDIELKWEDSGWPQSRNPEALKQALADQLGLELVPGRKAIEMLVVEKVK